MCLFTTYIDVNSKRSNYSFLPFSTLTPQLLVMLLAAVGKDNILFRNHFSTSKQFQCVAVSFTSILPSLGSINLEEIYLVHDYKQDRHGSQTLRDGVVSVQD